MMRRITRKLILLVAVVAAFAAMQGAALAAPPVGSPSEGPGAGDTGAFLCPAVGDGVDNASVNNSKNGNTNGVASFGILSGASLLPGNNQAGANANDSSWNEVGPGQSPGPGGSNSYADQSDWSPIWPGSG